MPSKRDFKVKDSWGIYDAYKLIRKNHWYDIGRPVSEHEFYTIIRSINSLLADEIAQGKTVVFPEKMGKLELWKYQSKAYFHNGKLNITYPIDWNSTKQLWEQDEEAKKNKTLIRFDSKWVYHVKYINIMATYENKVFYLFTLNNFIKDKLSLNIKQNKVDTIYG